MYEYQTSLSINECIEILNNNIEESKWTPYNSKNDLGIEYKKFRGLVSDNMFYIKSNAFGFGKYSRPTFQGLFMEDINGTKITGKFYDDLFARDMMMVSSVFFCIVGFFGAILSSFNLWQLLFLLLIVNPIFMIKISKKQRQKDVLLITTFLQEGFLTKINDFINK